MAITAERAVLIDFLEIYKDFTCLWDVTSNLYCNRDARSKALETLLEKLKEIEKDATIATVKRKLDNMRTAYKRELRKVEQSKTSGVGSGDIYVPSLWYFDYLTFLNRRETLNRSGVNSLTSCDDEVSEIQTNENVTPIRGNKKRATSLLKKQENLIESAQNLITGEEKESAAEVYGRSMGLQLNELSKMQRCIAEKLFSEIIFYGKLDKLTLQTTINLNNINTYDYAAPSPSSSSLTSFRFSPITTQSNISPGPSTPPNIITRRPVPIAQNNINTYDYVAPSPSPSSLTSFRFSPITTQSNISPGPSTPPNIITRRPVPIAQNNINTYDYVAPSPSQSSLTSFRFSQSNFESPGPSTAPNIITIRPVPIAQNISLAEDVEQPSTFITTSKYNIQDYLIFSDSTRK